MVLGFGNGQCIRHLVVEHERRDRQQENPVAAGDRNAIGGWPGIPGWPVDAFHVGCFPPDYRNVAGIHIYDADHCLPEHGSRASLIF